MILGKNSMINVLGQSDYFFHTPHCGLSLVFYIGIYWTNSFSSMAFSVFYPTEEYGAMFNEPLIWISNLGSNISTANL